jgi:DNA primase
MDDPEQKTAFYNQVSKKLLEFPEALERENYLEAVSREFFINYEDLKRLVNRLGATLGAVSPASKREEEKGFKDQKKKDKEDGVKQSQRLLLTWLIENPVLFDKIHGVITPEDFIEELYHKVAQMVFDGHAAGTLNPAEILNHFINDDDQYRAVAGLFHASLKESPNNEEQKKAFSETIMKVKKNSLDYASRHAEGIEELQRIIKEQAALKDLHISLD